MKSSLLFASCLAMAMAGSIDVVPDISPDTTLLASGDLQEPTLPSNLAEIPVYKVPYAEHLLDNVKTPEDFKALPPVTFYLYGSKASVNPWFYYSSRFKDMPEFSQYAIDEASEALSSIKSLSAGIPALMPYMPVYQVPYHEELLKDVKTPKDLEALPRVTLYIYGAKAEADPWIYYSHRFKDLPAFADYHHVKKEDSASNQAPPAAETAPTFGEDGLPTNLDSIPLYKVDYPENLVYNVKTPDDFDRLPQMDFYNNGSKIQVSPWSVYRNLFADLPEFSHYSPMGSIEDPLPAYISQIPWYNASYPTHLIEQAKTKEEILGLPDAVVYRYGVPMDIPAWKMFMLGDFDVTATQHQVVSVMGRSIDNAVPPLPQEPSASQLPEQLEEPSTSQLPEQPEEPSTSQLPEQPEAELTDDPESSSFRQVPYNEKLFDSIQGPEDYLELPNVIVYVDGKMSAIPAWIYYFDRFMGLETAMPDNEEEASEDNHGIEDERDVDLYLPDDHEEPSETINHGPDAAHTTLPPNLDTMHSWRVSSYPMELLDNVHNIEDLMNLPPAKVYMNGHSTFMPAYIVFRDRFKTLTESQPSTSTDMPTITSDRVEPHATFSSSRATGKGYDSSENENSPAMITAAPSSELPDNLDELKDYYVPYDMRLVEMAESPEDFRDLPDAIYYHYGKKFNIPAWVYFSSRIIAMASTRPGFDPVEFFAAPATTSHAPPSSSGPAIMPRGSVDGQPTASKTSDAVITPAPEFILPANINEIKLLEIPYNEDLINNVKKPEDFFGLPDFTVYVYGQQTIVPAWVHFWKKLQEVSEGRTSFVAHEFFAAAATTSSHAPSFSSGPAIMPRGSVDEQSTASQTIDAVITPAPELDLPANLEEIELFEIPYNEDLIKKIKKPEDFFGLPDYTAYVYGRKTVVPAWLHFSKKLDKVSEDRTSFAAFEFFAAAATATAQASSSSSGPVIATPAAINALPVITDAPETSNNAVVAYPELDLPGNIDEIPEFEVPYDLSLLDNVKTPQDLANLPDAIFFEYGHMKAVPAIQHFAPKLLELVKASSTSIDPFDIFKPGPDFATEEPQTLTTFSTITRTTSSASLKTIKS